MSKFTTTIGLEVHAAISESSVKLFSMGLNEKDPEKPNSDLDFLDVGLPGTLPLLNLEPVLHAARTCIGLRMKKIANIFSFDRKSYFYPDLSLGYQITQFHHPIGTDGELTLNMNKVKKTIRIRQLHMETDAGKSIHSADCTLLDYNRCGSPLMEIVTQPDFTNAEEVVLFVRMLRATLKHVKSSDANMELGNLRVDVSISISSTDELGTRVEIKNLNSYRSIRKAIEYETQRQEKILLSGERVRQETRLFDDKTGKTVFMRSKEDADEYMYFREPDLPMYYIDDATILAEKDKIFVLPEKMLDDLCKEYGYHESFVNMVEEPFISSFVRFALSGCGPDVQKQVLKIIAGEIFSRLKEDSAIPINPKHLQTLAKLVLSKNLTSMIIKTIMDEMWETDEDPEKIMQEKGLVQVEDEDTIRGYVKQILTDNPDEVAKYLDGRTNLRGFFLGQAMKKDRIEPKILNKILDEELVKISETSA